MVARPSAPLGHTEAMGLAETEFARAIAQLRDLSDEDWRRPTVCELWDVRDLASHVLGMAEAQASVRQFAHDYRSARKRSGGKMIDGMTATQVAERAFMTPEAIVNRLAVIAPKAVNARRRTPALIRNAVRMKQDPPFDMEKWRFGYLVDTIFTRESGSSTQSTGTSPMRSPSRSAVTSSSVSKNHSSSSTRGNNFSAASRRKALKPHWASLK